MNGHDIITTRVFDFPRERVFSAWADAAQVAVWWGPEGFTNTIHEFDLRPGGKWRFTMHGPDGKDYDNEKTFLEVVPGEKVTFQHEAPVHRFRMELTWSDEAGGTRLTWLMRFEDPPEAEKLRGFIEPANEQNFARLQSFLEQNP